MRFHKLEYSWKYELLIRYSETSNKNTVVKKVRNGYGLYECTSTYVPGQKYPKSLQKYLGMITEEDGFIPKKSVSDTASFSIEYGLSHFIISNFRRDLQRSVFNSDMAIVVCHFFILFFFIIRSPLDKRIILIIL